LHAVPGALAELPTGAMIAVGAASYLIAGGRAHRWTPDGYQAASQLTSCDGMLTPPSTLRALIAGYRPLLHPSLGHS
jgi:hypothetical protein